MRLETQLIFVIFTFIANKYWHVDAYLYNTPGVRRATRDFLTQGGGTATLNNNDIDVGVGVAGTGDIGGISKIPTGNLMSSYPVVKSAADTSQMSGYLDAAANAALQQHGDSNEETRERVVYDPGDELLRALNAEIAATGQELGTLPEEPDYADTVYNELEVASKHDMLRKLEDDLREEQDFVTKSALLVKMLEDPSIDTLPVVYVEEPASIVINDENIYEPTAVGMNKRSRFYRRYPWKRHNRHSNFDPDLRYACTPSKEDVFKLLLNLHETRKGNHSKTINFCNRKRPAKAIFTNIRFLG